jgi:hypothetical protein
MTIVLSAKAGRRELRWDPSLPCGISRATSLSSPEPEEG